MNSNIVFNNFVWRFSERILAQFVTFAVSIIIARLLMPTDYAAISIILVFITFANILVSNGFSTALIQKKNADTLDFSSVFYFSVIFSLFLYLILFLIAPFIAIWYNMPILSPALRVLGIRIIISSINSVQHSFVSRNMIFKKFFFSTLGGTIISAIVGIVMAYIGFGLWALVFQYLTNTLIDTIVLWFTVRWRPTKEFSLFRLKVLLSYGWKLLASALIGSVYDDVRTLIIGKIYTKDELAFYSKGQQFPKLIMSNLSTSLMSVLFPYYSKMQNQKEKLRLTVRKTIIISTSIISPMMIGILAISYPLVKLLLTDKWLDCVPYLQVCCIFYLISSIYNIHLQAYKSIGKSGLALIIELIDDIFGIILVVLFYKFGPFAIALIMVLSRLVAYFICIPITKKLLSISIVDQLLDVIKPIAFSLVMLSLILLINCFNMNYIILMIIQIILGLLIYVLLCLLFNRSFINDLYNMFHNSKKGKILNDN